MNLAIGGSAYTIAAAPLLPWWAIAALAGAALLILALYAGYGGGLGITITGPLF